MKAALIGKPVKSRDEEASARKRIAEIDAIVTQSLEALALELASGSWRGRREPEVVSLFCFGHLVGHCRPATALADPSQISIEVTVPQIPETAGSKMQVCKDIVIWPRPRMACWDEDGKPTVRPLSILEWKHNEGDMSEGDTIWLQKFSAEAPGFVGFAVATNQTASPFTISCNRLCAGQRIDRWVHIR
jgi:hypothetical protein